MIVPVRELKRWIRIRVMEIRDVTGFDIAALKLLSKAAATASNHRNHNFYFGDYPTMTTTDIWAGLGLGSDVAAALEGRPNRR